MTGRAFRPPTYNPNKARDEKRRELQALRREARELEVELRRLTQAHARAAATPVPDDADAADAADTRRRRAAVWKQIATNQLRERRRAERDNEQLQAALATHLQLAHTLQTTLRRRPPLPGSRRVETTRLVSAAATSDADRAVFEELLARAEDCYREIDPLFVRLGISATESSFRDARIRSDGGDVEVCAANVLPFAVHEAGEAAWQYMAHHIDQLPFRQYFERVREPMDSPADTIIESLGLEFHANDTRAVFQLKQVLRRFVERDRVVIVWTSVIVPVEFAGEHVAHGGYFFREKGYLSLQRATREPPRDHCVLKTCYVLSPEFRHGSALREGDDVVRRLTDFALRGTDKTIATAHQTIENMLVADALTTPRNRVA